MKETNEVLDLVLEVVKDVVAAKADGKIELAEMIAALAGVAPKVFPAVDNVKGVVEELKNAKQEEIMALLEKMKVVVPQAGKIGLIVSKAFVVLKDAKEVYEAIKA